MGTGSDGSASTGLLDKVDPSTWTPNVDGLEVWTRGNVSCRTGKHSPDHGSILKIETVSDISLGTRTSNSYPVDGKANLAIADTGTFVDELVDHDGKGVKLTKE